MAEFIELGLTIADDSFWTSDREEEEYNTYFINIDKIISLEWDKSIYEGTFLTIEGLEHSMYSIVNNPFEIMEMIKEIKEGKEGDD